MKKYATDIMTVNFNSSLHSVIQDIEWKKISCAVVVDDFGDVFGIITDSDVANFEKQGRPFKNSLAWELCSHKLIEADVSASTQEVARLMLNNNVHHIMIIDSSNGKKAVGIVSSLDVIDELLESK